MLSPTIMLSSTQASEACNFIKRENLAQVFSCEFCEISKNTFFYRTPPVAASVCCRRKVAAVKIEKLKAFIIRHYDISKTYSVQFHLFYSVNLSYFYFFTHGFQSSILHKLKTTLICWLKLIKVRLYMNIFWLLQVGGPFFGMW